MFRRRRARRNEQLLCIEFVEVVTDYLEGAMDAGERARFESHFAACPHCSRYLDQMRETIAQVGRLTVDDVDVLDPSARDELLAAFREYYAAG